MAALLDSTTDAFACFVARRVDPVAAACALGLPYCEESVARLLMTSAIKDRIDSLQRDRAERAFRA